ncbi:MAG: rRNA pseudouridine synthase [Thermoguttaceae bacterium]|jgi:23S rRNA pseudouridine2605 synthase|nr:rRNA pseudouridine synthase [Thermoguttaceae bacterium]
MSAMPRRRKSRPFSRGGSPRKVSSSSEGERLQKVLAAAGLGSRRQCEELIRTGRVEVDRRVVTELGTRVDPTRQEIRVDGDLLRQPERLYFAVNKPSGVVSTNRDPAGRRRVIDLVPTRGHERLFSVGRLDLYSEGLILVTNDGELANRLTHPRYEVEKTYRVLVAGSPSREVLDQLRRGVHLAEGVARASRIEVKKQLKQSTVLEITLKEGKNREIRRILARVGHKVLRLLRISVGPIRLGKLPPGACRRLSRAEVDALWKAAR